MRWFKHLADARHNPKFLRVEKKLGEAGYARIFKLLEMVAERGGTGEDFRPQINLKDPHTGLDWIADEWGVKPREAKKTLDAFARVRLIDPEAWRKKVVAVPQMIEYRDEWTRKKQARRNGGSPENSGVGQENSPQSQSQSQSQNSELEAEQESESDGDDRKADSADRPAKSKYFDSDIDLLLTVTNRRFDPVIGFNGYSHRVQFVGAVLVEVERQGLPATDNDREQFMGAVVDLCDEKGFKVPPGWIRVLSDLRRELGIGK